MNKEHEYIFRDFVTTLLPVLINEDNVWVRRRSESREFPQFKDTGERRVYRALETIRVDKKGAFLITAIIRFKKLAEEKDKPFKRDFSV